MIYLDFNELCRNNGIQIKENTKGVIGVFVVLLYFRPSHRLLVWGEQGFREATDYNDAVEKIKECKLHINRLELQRKQNELKCKLYKMEADFG